LFYDFSGEDIQGNKAVALFATVTSCGPFILFPFFLYGLVKHPLKRKLCPNRYRRDQDSMLKTMVSACETLGHLTAEDVVLLLQNMEEYDQRTFYAACVTISAELHNEKQNRLSSGLSRDLGETVSQRAAASKSTDRAAVLTVI